MYRLQQFFWALGARMGPAARAEVETLLTPAQLDLFRRMPRYDQRHSLHVMRTLRAAGHRQPDLLIAALLHDAAKSTGPLRLWHSVTIVLLKALAPHWLARLAREAEPGNWRYPFYAHRRHAEIGARRAESVGCSRLTVWLVAHHQSVPRPEREGPENLKEGLLAALRWADDQN
jgi:hypothetical protein